MNIWRCTTLNVNTAFLFMGHALAPKFHSKVEYPLPPSPQESVPLAHIFCLIGHEFATLENTIITFVPPKFCITIVFSWAKIEGEHCIRPSTRLDYRLLFTFISPKGGGSKDHNNWESTGNWKGFSKPVLHWSHQFKTLETSFLKLPVALLRMLRYTCTGACLHNPLCPNIHIQILQTDLYIIS